jgi:hypothetical protein
MAMDRIARQPTLLHAVLLLLASGGCVTQSVSGIGAGAGGDGGGGSGGGAQSSSSTSASTTGSGASCPLGACDDLPGFKGSKSCQPCHTAIYADWESSMHAHSITSPVMIAQANQVFAADLIREENQESSQFCTSCHSPLSTRFAEDGSRLPFTSTQPNTTPEALRGGIGCVTCHAYDGTPQDSRAVLTAFQQDFSAGASYFGPFDNPAPNGGVHASSTTALYENGTEDLCWNCHNTKKDRNGNGVFELGADLILQNTFDQYYEYRGSGERTCLECHMPLRHDVNQAADGFPGAPIRAVHDHKFVGVDFPLDAVASGHDPQKLARRDLLVGGNTNIPPASLAIENVVFDGTNLAFDVSIVNQDAGHDLPTGFTFMRQMWLEVVVKDSNQMDLATSGKLQAAEHDLCDHDTLTDAYGPIVQGCPNNVPDQQLVNFQTQLVDFVALDNGVLVKDPVKGHETHLQFQTGGAVPRSRPADLAAGIGPYTLAPIRPFDKRTFHYVFVIPPQTDPIVLTTKLQFRNLPPYFMRRLAQTTPDGGAELGSLLKFEITTMNAHFFSVPVSP